MNLKIDTKPKMRICSSRSKISLAVFTITSENDEKLGEISGDDLQEYLEKYGFKIVELDESK